MSNLSSKKVQDIHALYEGMYQKEETLTEQQVSELIAIEWYNALVEGGIIDGEIITENAAANPNLWTRLGNAIMTGGPKVMRVLQRVTGFGLKNAGNKRRIVTAGAGTATAIDPQKAAQQVGGAVTGTANVVRGAVKGGWDAATGNNSNREKEEAASNPKAYIDPATGTIKYTK